MRSKIKVYIQHHGNMHCDPRWLINTPLLMASRREPHKAAEWRSCPTHTVVVDHPDGRILMDTACPRNWEERWGATGLQEFFPYDEVKPEEYFEERLKQLKLDPSDFKYVFLTHLHFDHAGNIGVFKHSGAEVVVNKTEYNEAMKLEGISQGGFIKADYDMEGIKYHLVEGDTQLVDGVTLLETPGHTWGTMCMQVDLPNSGTIIFTSDAIYLRDSYGPPAVGSPVVYDNLQWARSVEKIRNIAHKKNATIVFGHDHAQIKELRLAPEAYYD
ncbi:N-acyl homoserine lactonase family protein [Ktedonosporobacter rubrisoli]|uniref:N-acyl homoserine lactonase family protein n=1 Tax=Ktedonosporobacter rubrisoli TaxID=2509675 RepID=A0A4V0Z0M3_KTERU|nr:N-acyl homoserine lactonase family protein [Ktedonosporobacter rubrisoli]